MGKTIVISGGNSGIGLKAGRQLAAQGHTVVLLGRDARKGAAAVSSIQAAGGAAEFIACDLSTHEGVRAAAKQVLGKPRIDGLVLGAGVLTMQNIRTADNLNPVLAVNYLSRYHLAQLLMPKLLESPSPTVVILVAGVPLNSQINFEQFPRFEPWPGMRALSSVQIANHHYVAHLAAKQPKVKAAVVNVGLVKTDIMRAMPLPLRVAFPLLAPVITIPVSKSASNATWLSTNDGWQSGAYLPKPGQPENQVRLALDPAVTEKVVAASRVLTGS